MVRFAKKEDFDFVKKSWEVCFDDTPEFVEWNFDKNYSCENTVISESDSSSASVMQLMPYELNMGGFSLSARYVSGVATLPEFRGRGLVRNLFEFGLPSMYDMGCDISILIPAVSGMYEKFGYCKIQERTFYVTDKLPKGRCITNYDEKIIPVLDGIYRADVQKKSCFVSRCKWDWERILTDLLTLSRGAIVIAEENGVSTGYVLAYPKGDGFEIVEVCGKIGTEGEAKEQPPIMARIINVNKIKTEFATTLGDVGIKDDYITQNNVPGEKTVDIAEFTEMFFEKIKEEFKQDMYINLLL